METVKIETREVPDKPFRIEIGKHSFAFTARVRVGAYAGINEDLEIPELVKFVRGSLLNDEERARWDASVDSMDLLTELMPMAEEVFRRQNPTFAEDSGSSRGSSPDINMGGQSLTVPSPPAPDGASTSGSVPTGMPPQPSMSPGTSSPTG